jgi:hypothetical protein
MSKAADESPRGYIFIYCCLFVLLLEKHLVPETLYRPSGARQESVRVTCVHLGLIKKAKNARPCFQGFVETRHCRCFLNTPDLRAR